MTPTAREFKDHARQFTGDLRHRELIRKALSGYEVKRDENKARFQDWETARQALAEMKYDVINHLDQYLETFVRNLEARGVKVLWATDAKEARQLVVQIAQENKVRSVIKSKSMLSEEIHLNDALEKEGLEVVE